MNIKRTLTQIPIKTGKGIGKLLVWSGAFVLAILIFLQVAMWLGVVWLNTQSGGQWVEARLGDALKESGYSVRFDSFKYSFPTGVGVVGLVVSDQDGAFLNIDYARVHVSPLPLAYNTFDLALDAGQAKLFRLPAAAEEEPEEEPEEGKPIGVFLPPFEIPDIYFTSVNIHAIRVQRLELSEDVAGTFLAVPIEVNAEFRLDENQINVDLSGDFERNDVTVWPWLPAAVNMHLSLVPKTSLLTLEGLTVLSEGYTAAAQGRAVLAEGGELDLSLEARISDMASLAEGMEGTAHVKARITGTQSAPLIAGEGSLSMAHLGERGLGDVLFTLTANDVTETPGGSFEIKTTYQEKPVTLSAGYVYADNVLTLDTIKGSAPSATVEGDVALDITTTLATGDVRITVQDFATYSDLAGADIGGRGAFGINLYGYGEAINQAADIKADISSLRFEDITVASIKADTTIPDFANIWPGKTDIRIRTLAASGAEFDTLNITLNPAGQDHYKLSLDGEGRYQTPLSLRGGADIKNIASGKPSAENIDVTISLSGEPVRIKGNYNPETIDLTLETQKFPVSAAVGPSSAMPGDVSVTGNTRLFGALAQPEITADFALSTISFGENNASITLGIQGGYKDGQASVTLNGTGEGVRTLQANAGTAMKFSLSPFVFELAETAPLSGRLNGDLQIAPLANALLPPDHMVSGLLNIHAEFGGTISSPSYSGSMTFADGNYLFQPMEVRLADINLDGRFSNDKLILNSLRATDAEGGTLSGNGEISLGAGNLATNVTLQAKSMHLLRDERAEGRLSADLKLSGVGTEYLLSGTIKPDRIDITIPERFNQNIPELNIVEKGEYEAADITDEGGIEIKLNMVFQAENQIFVRGWGLDAEMGGTLEITGTAAEPLVNGDWNVIRGRYEEFGTRFTIEKANMRFQGTVPPSPYLDILVENQAGDVKAQVLIKGSATEPKISFASVPALPEDEVLARILFGRDMSRITPFQAVQLAQTMRRFSGQGGGGFDPLGQLRQMTGLDDLTVETDDEGGATVGAGKYLTDKVYLGIEQGSSENSGAATLEIELTPTISIESEVGQDAQGGAGVFWQWDY